MGGDRYFKRIGRAGAPHCVVCGDTCPPGRTSACSDECARTRDLAYPSRLRRAVWERDHGICALCGMDTHKLARIMRWAEIFDEVSRGLYGNGVSLPRKVWVTGDWEVDHDPPVSEGGGVRLGMSEREIMSGVRTLCVACHKLVTKRQSLARAVKTARENLEKMT